MPGMYGTGRGTVLYLPWMPSRSLKFNVTDVTRIFSSPACGVGWSTSSSRSTSRGAPYWCTLQAFTTTSSNGPRTVEDRTYDTGSAHQCVRPEPRGAQ